MKSRLECQCLVDRENRTIVVHLTVGLGKQIWLSQKLPKDGVPGWTGWMGPFWLPLLAANLRAHVGLELAEVPGFDMDRQVIYLRLSDKAFEQFTDPFQTIGQWVVAYMLYRAELKTSSYMRPIVMTPN